MVHSISLQIAASISGSPKVIDFLVHLSFPPATLLSATIILHYLSLRASHIRLEGVIWDLFTTGCGSCQFRSSSAFISTRFINLTSEVNETKENREGGN